jgi:hypothetical protein
MIVVYASVAAWRGFQRRRSRMQTRSWIGLTVTLIAGLVLVGFGLAIANGVDRHVAWVGAPRSSTRATWTLISLVSLVGGVLLPAAALAWFGYADPTMQFPLVNSRRSTPDEASDALPR